MTKLSFCYTLQDLQFPPPISCLKSVSQRDTAVSSQKRPKSVLDTDDPYHVACLCMCTCNIMLWYAHCIYTIFVSLLILFGTNKLSFLVLVDQFSKLTWFSHKLTHILTATIQEVFIWGRPYLVTEHGWDINYVLTIGRLGLYQIPSINVTTKLSGEQLFLLWYLYNGTESHWDSLVPVCNGNVCRNMSIVISHL